MANLVILNESGLFEIDLQDPSWGLVGSRGQILIQKGLNFQFYMVNRQASASQKISDMK